MNCAELVKALRERIETSLTPLITADYWLMEIPHYDNVGDTLIWQGEMDFLKGLSYKCRGMRALDSWRSAHHLLQPQLWENRNYYETWLLNCENVRMEKS